MERPPAAAIHRSPEGAYLLPIRSRRPHGPELTEYLRGVASTLAVVVVDGSSAAVFDAVHEDWSTFAVHVRPAPDIGGANGKVRGVLTGLRFVTSDIVVIADDDVRYEA